MMMMRYWMKIFFSSGDITKKNGFGSGSGFSFGFFFLVWGGKQGGVEN